jgi:hypothetical protein
MSGRSSYAALRRLPPLLADLVCVAAFALGGRASHEPGAAGWVILSIAWPYAVSAVLAHAWLYARGGRTRRIWPEGVVITAVTYALGMVLRVASGRGIAVAFLVVAVLFLAVTMLGWRAAVALIARRRTSQPS